MTKSAWFSQRQCSVHTISAERERVVRPSEPEISLTASVLGGYLKASNVQNVQGQSGDSAKCAGPIRTAYIFIVWEECTQ